MADVKISQLPSATLPLAGTEVLPIVQSGTTSKVAISDLTAGRAVSMTSVTVAAGTAALPAITTTGDTNTGIFFPAADQVATTVGGSEQMRLTSTGLGIGTSSPTSKLTVLTATTNAGIAVNDGTINTIIFNSATGAASIGTTTNHPVDFYTNNAGRMHIDSAGNVGIGTSSPLGTAANRIALTVNGTTDASINVANGGIQRAYLYGSASLGRVGTIGALPLVFAPNDTERLRIDSAGNVAITQTPGSYTIDTSGGATSIANNGTVDFPNAAGMLLVNNYTNGHITLYLCGGGAVHIVANIFNQVGSFNHNAGINGYTWTNNFGSTATFGFFFVRTRPAA